MRHINEDALHTLLAAGRQAPAERVRAILARSRALRRLSLEETAMLVSVTDPLLIDEILRGAAAVKEAVYGKRIVLFAPLYLGNRCANACVYCAFKADNPACERVTLTQKEIAAETEALLAMGHRRVLVVAAESAEDDARFFTESIGTIYGVRRGACRITRLNINCAPLSSDGFRQLKAAGIGTYQLFQETYDERVYRLVHPSGPKSDPDRRIEAIDQAFTAGIDDIGMGVLYGLTDWRFDTLALLMHIEYLERTYQVGPHTISVPRLEPATGVDLSPFQKTLVSDEEFKRIVAILRLSVPYTGIILSTRETAAMRDELFTLGISQASAASATGPGGYARARGDERDTQFVLSDDRTLDEVIASLIAHGTIPSFCTACYRSSRTGEAFMKLARPGTIQGKCRMNALITLKEYLDDFASPAVRQAGYRLIERETARLSPEEQRMAGEFFAHIGAGVRDEHV